MKTQNLLIEISAKAIIKKNISVAIKSFQLETKLVQLLCTSCSAFYVQKRQNLPFAKKNMKKCFILWWLLFFKDILQIVHFDI